MSVHTGGCYCGNISIRFESEKAADELTPRACDCGFCTAHGAAWLSDPNGALEITVQNEAALSVFRQGSEQAHFWLCQRCGVVTAVTCEIEGQEKGAVNATVLDDRKALPASVAASPKILSAEEKLARWGQLWIPTVEIKSGW